MRGYHPAALAATGVNQIFKQVCGESGRCVVKIMLDAGHYGKYNQGVNKNYYESEAMWKLHLLLKAELEKYGFEVGTTSRARPKERFRR